MKLSIAAVGRLGHGPEGALVDDYLKRANAAGRGIALGPVTLTEIDERKARSREEQSAKLRAALTRDAEVVVLDERGETLTSPDFAKRLARLRDRGVSETAFLIGGADGHTQELRDRAGLLLSFGPMVWPHMLARVMLAEQIYRAVTILSGGPYHRS